MKKHQPKIIRFTMTKEMDFTQAVTEFLKVFRKAAEEDPTADRHVYLEIEGHENEEMGLDGNGYEFLRMVGKMNPYWKELNGPGGSNFQNELDQKEFPPKTPSLLFHYLGFSSNS